VSNDWFAARPVASLLRDCTSEDGRVSGLFEPLSAQGEDEMQKISQLIDYLHAQLMTLSPEFDYLEEDDEDTEGLADFIAEGRKMLCITESRVCWGQSEDDVAHGVWSTVAALLNNATPDSGVLIAMPTYEGDSRRYLDDEVLTPLLDIGIRRDLLDARAYRVSQGAPFPAFRLIYDPSDAPSDDQVTAAAAASPSRGDASAAATAAAAGDDEDNYGITVS